MWDYFRSLSLVRDHADKLHNQFNHYAHHSDFAVENCAVFAIFHTTLGLTKCRKALNTYIQAD